MNLQAYRQHVLDGTLPDRAILRGELGLPASKTVTITASMAEKLAVVRGDAEARRMKPEEMLAGERTVRRRVEITKAEMLLSVEPISEELKAVIGLILRWERSRI